MGHPKRHSYQRESSPRTQNSGASARSRRRQSQPRRPHNSRRRYPPSSTKASYSAFVTGVEEIRKGATSTGCAHFSLSKTKGSSGEAPSMKVPPRTSTSRGWYAGSIVGAAAAESTLDSGGRG